MLRLISIVVSCIIVLLVLAFPCQASIVSSYQATDDFDKIFFDMVADYELFTSLCQDVYPFQQYNLALHATNPDTANAYLSTGFSPDLAQAISTCYLQWLPEIDKIAIIPTDSIPVITNEDRGCLNMRRISPDEIIMERIYSDCYIIGDRYLYSITARRSSSRWIICGLKLEPL